MDDDNLYYIVSQNIKKQRKLKGWTQVKLAMKSNISVDYLKKIETKSGSVTQFDLSDRLGTGLFTENDDTVSEPAI